MNIPTTKQFLKSFPNAKDISTEQLLIAFTKIHLQAQLKAILENATIDDFGSPNGDGEWMPCNIINEESIINAYPLTLIK